MRGGFDLFDLFGGGVSQDLAAFIGDQYGIFDANPHPEERLGSLGIGWKVKSGLHGHGHARQQNLLILSLRKRVTKVQANGMAGAVHEEAFVGTRLQNLFGGFPKDAEKIQLSGDHVDGRLVHFPQPYSGPDATQGVLLSFQHGPVSGLLGL